MERDPVPFVPPAPPVTPKATATRRRIIEAASDLFIERGYNAVSMRDVAEQADLTTGGLYGHFRSKGQLLVETIRWKLAEFDHSEAVVQARRHRDTAAGLMLDDRLRAVRLLEVDATAAARHDPEVAAGLAEFYRERQAALRQGLTGVVEDPDTVGWLIFVLAAGIGAKEAIGETPPSPESFRSAVRAMGAAWS